MTVEQLCEEIAQKRAERYKRDLGPWPKNNMTASDISECPRESVFAVTNWQDRPAFDPELKMRLERGNKIEDLVMAELQALGYRVRVERKPFEIKDKHGRLVCRGKVDGFVDPPDSRTDVPFEGKSLHPNVYARIDRQEDFDRYLFFKKYPKQLQTYLLANNLEEGFWILDDCLGHWKLIPCRLDYERMDKVLQHLELVAEHLAKKTLPDYHGDPAVCLKCWAYGRVCNPPFFATGEGLRLINDPEVETKLKRLDEIRPIHREFDNLNDEVKELFKNKTNLIVGDWLIRGEEKIRKEKARAARESTYWRMTIEKLSEGSDA